MKLKHLSILFLAISFFSFQIPNKIQKRIDKEIREVYQVEEFSFEAFQISEEITKIVPSKFDEDNLFKITANNLFLGYAYIAKARSKTAKFDYLVLLDTDLVVKKAKVLVYREEYGGEISSKRWLKQFIGKSKNDTVKYQEDIIAISGATISVRSMTKAMNDLLESLKILNSKNIL
jgi:hypothetical protein